ncbi:hypothetical protein Tco_0550259, partial [Tanacetum coccineum]
LLTKGFDAGRFQYLVSKVMGTKVVIVFQFLSLEALFEGRFLISTTTCMDERIKTHLAILQEVGTPRYLSLVVPLAKVGDEAVHKELGNRIERAATTASSLKAEQVVVPGAKIPYWGM